MFDAMTPIPLILYGDGPRLPSGLGRIARDLGARIYNEQDTLGVRLAQVGVDPPDGWHFQAWDFWGFQPGNPDQGRSAVAEVVYQFRKEGYPEPIILMIMDPSRCWDLTRTAFDNEEIEINSERLWGYFPIDSENVKGSLSGPAAEAVCTCSRLLGYGSYGATVLKQTLHHADRVSLTPIPYLPHGIEPVFNPEAPPDEEFVTWRSALPAETLILGCVATNQPRKDLGTLFAAAALLKMERPVALWLHTDLLTKAWDVGQLVKDFGFEKTEVCVSTANLPDATLAGRYASSDVTIAPGLGEGFGYPIVESLACGTPVIHVHYGGGVELVPDANWLIEPVAWRLESVYAIKRPVLDPRQVSGAALDAALWKRAEPELCKAYCSGAVEHLLWGNLWPRWRQWIKQGIRQAQEGL